MGITRKPSGRFIVGLGVTDGNDYKEVGALKDLFIQLTEDGCTDESQNYLDYLKDYADYHNILGEPIMPPGVNVWLSNNGTTTAVEADDLSLEDGVYTICGIKCEDGTWDFTNAGQQGGGGSDLPEVDDSDNGKVLTVVEGAWSAASATGGGGLLVTVTWNEEETTATLDKNYNEIRTALSSGIPVLGIDLYEAEGEEEIDCYYIGYTAASEIGYKVTMRAAGATSFGELEFVASTPTGTLTYTSGT